MESLGDCSSSLPCVSLEPASDMFYFVRRSDDSWYVGEIIQKREVELDNEKKKEFFIHFKDCKKLLICSIDHVSLILHVSGNKTNSYNKNKIK